MEELGIKCSEFMGFKRKQGKQRSSITRTQNGSSGKWDQGIRRKHNVAVREPKEANKLL